MAKTLSKYSCWIALACLVVPMFASYYFDDMFSTLSHLFENPSMLQLGWNSADYGLYTSGYSVLCVFGALWSAECCWTNGACVSQARYSSL